MCFTGSIPSREWWMSWQITSGRLQNDRLLQVRKQGCPKMVYKEVILAVEGALDKEAGCDT